MRKNSRARPTSSRKAQDLLKQKYTFKKEVQTNLEPVGKSRQGCLGYSLSFFFLGSKAQRHGTNATSSPPHYLGSLVSPFSFGVSGIVMTLGT